MRGMARIPLLAALAITAALAGLLAPGPPGQKEAPPPAASPACGASGSAGGIQPAPPAGSLRWSCRVATHAGPVECRLVNQDDGDGRLSGRAQLRWRRVGGELVVNDFNLPAGYHFLRDTRPVEVGAVRGGVPLLLVTGFCLGGSSLGFHTTALTLNPRGPRPQRLGACVDGELPGGYLVDRQRSTVLFWRTAWDWERESHAEPHRFRFDLYRLDARGWSRRWTGLTRRKYPWDDPSLPWPYRDRPGLDPLREIGRRWLARWLGRRW
jgi:hypothetical protein